MADEERVHVLMSAELKEKLKALAKRDGRVLIRQIEHVLKEYVATQEKTDGVD